MGELNYRELSSDIFPKPSASAYKTPITPNRRRQFRRSTSSPTSVTTKLEKFSCLSRQMDYLLADKTPTSLQSAYKTPPPTKLLTPTSKMLDMNIVGKLKNGKMIVWTFYETTPISHNRIGTRFLMRNKLLRTFDGHEGNQQKFPTKPSNKNIQGFFPGKVKKPPPGFYLF